MKMFTAALAFLFFLPNAFASTEIHEELFVVDPDKKYLKLLLSNGDLVVDHVNNAGYELYGPKGLSRWLDEKGISYLPEINVSMIDRSGYPSFTEIESDLMNLESTYPNIMKLESIGTSVQGRDLYVMKVSDNVQTDELEPEVKFISSMHGDEITGRESMMRLLADIGAQYGVDPAITDLVDNTEIYIMPSMNPDGSEVPRRSNANFVDLNRDFPDFTTSDNVNTPNGRQPETAAVMNFQAARQFALSANYHGGAEVCNYPWDTQSVRHPFNNLILGLCSDYADSVPYMYSSSYFPGGVTNGYDWYEVNGGMQDWSYYWHNDLQVTVEISGAKWPSYSLMDYYFNENKTAMYDYLADVHQGAGFQIAMAGQAGTVQIENLVTGDVHGPYDFHSSEFFKVLPQGDYRFSVQLNPTDIRVFETTVTGIVANDGNYTQI